MVKEHAETFVIPRDDGGFDVVHGQKLTPAPVDLETAQKIAASAHFNGPAQPRLRIVEN